MTSRSKSNEAAAGNEPAAARSARFVEHARRYSELGWALVRLDGKVPKGTGWQQQPPTSPEHAAGLWSRWGERWNMGVVLGSSGLAVVEYDTDAAGEKLIKLLGGELPLTPVAQTGRGRLHLYFTAAGVDKTTRAGLELRPGAPQCGLPPAKRASRHGASVHVAAQARAVEGGAGEGPGCGARLLRRATPERSDRPAAGPGRCG
jgi:hypothetical protein